MNPIRRAWCRTFQTAFRIALPLLPYREPKILHSVEEVPGVLASQGLTSALLVTDAGIARLGLTRALEEALAGAGISCAVYDGTVANPTVANVEAALGVYHDHGCQAIIGFGGGSAMDCAKAGSEVTLAAVITDERTHHKYPINDFFLIPTYAVHDWRLTEGLPASVTAQTGMDALTHAIEAYVGRSTTRLTREKALSACRLIHDNLADAYDDPHNARARRNMLRAAYDAGIAFTQSYVGYVHAIAHSLGGLYGIPHGLANAVILPHVLRAYGESAEPRLADVARACGISPDGASDHDAARSLIGWIDAANARMGIPDHLEGIRASDVTAMAAHADAEANPLYPVPVEWDRAQLEAMYHVVAGGTLADEADAAPAAAAPAHDANNRTHFSAKNATAEKDQEVAA